MSSIFNQMGSLFSAAAFSQLMIVVTNLLVYQKSTMDAVKIRPGGVATTERSMRGSAMLCFVYSIYS